MKSKKSFNDKWKRILRIIVIALIDVIIAGAIVAGVYVYTYKIPRRLNTISYKTASLTDPLQERFKKTKSYNNTIAAEGLDTEWSKKFKDKFSDTVISDENNYIDKNISIRLLSINYDSKKDYVAQEGLPGLNPETNATASIDTTKDAVNALKGKERVTLGIKPKNETESGNPFSGEITQSYKNPISVDYGSKIAYVLADIYISDITCIKTAFAKDEYGIGYSEKLLDMSDRMKAVLGVNGDSYSNNQHLTNGTIIRNGMVYRTDASTEETCVLYKDGRMKIFEPEDFDAKEIIDDGAWQTWVFGPSLLDEKGNPKKNFHTWDYIRKSHPRTAIGYYEPGHYCILVVDGRNPGYSRGMYLEEMAELFSKLGCKVAYNLDGGYSAAMVRQGSVITNPYKPSREVSDGLFICEPEVTK